MYHVLLTICKSPFYIYGFRVFFGLNIVDQLIFVTVTPCFFLRYGLTP